MFQDTLQRSEELSWWHGSLVLSPSPLKHEFRNYWRKNSVTVLLVWWHTASTSNFFATHTTPHPRPCPTSWQLRNINNVRNVQGTLTCPTPPQPLPHILAVAEHQQRVQRTRNVNMPHPTPAPAPHPGSCGTQQRVQRTRNVNMPHPSPCPTSWQLRNINNVCNVEGTLTCPTPPQPLPHILAGAEHQQRVQRTRNVNMPHPTPAPAPHPGSCGTSTTCATNGERHKAVYAACANYY